MTLEVGRRARRGKRVASEARSPDTPAMTGLRILHCHSTFALGGKEARAVRLMNAWGARAHHTVLAASDDWGAREAIDPGIAVDFPRDAPSLMGKPGLRRYRDLARYTAGFDLVLTYNWGAMDVVGARRLFGKRMHLPPLIHHEDGFNVDEATRTYRRRNAFRRYMLPAAHAVAVPSHRLERIARRRWGVRAPVRIANGIPTQLYAGSHAPGLFPDVPRRNGELLVGTIAGLRRVKDLPLLVEAVARADAPLRLVIVGQGPERETIACAALAHDIADRVHLVGFMAEPHRYVGAFDVLALSSLSEQQPISVIEGMAAGLPIVAPDVGDIAMMVSDENRRFVTERSVPALSAALTELARDPMLRALVGEANRAKARAEFDEITMVARYARLYGEAVGRPGALLASG